MFIDFREAGREGEREREREREALISCFPYVLQLGIETATLARYVH